MVELLSGATSIVISNVGAVNLAGGLFDYSGYGFGNSLALFFWRDNVSAGKGARLNKKRYNEAIGFAERVHADDQHVLWNSGGDVCS